MVKKILLAVVGGVVALLVLTLALTLLLSYREFFGTVITWVLCICVAALAAFVIYLVVRYTLDTLRKKGTDDEALSEHHIKELLLSGEPRDKGVIRDGAVEPAALEAGAPEATAHGAGAQSTSLFDAPAPGQTPEVRRAAERTAELRKLEEEHRRKLAEAEARARQAAQAEMAARERAVAEGGPAAPAAPAGRRHLAGTGELLRRTSEFAAQKASSVDKPAPVAPAVEEPAAAPAPEEVKSVRRQAEAAAAARRRAAQMAARSQSFPAIRPDTLSAIQAQDGADDRPNLYETAADSKVRYANEPVPFEASGEDSIWDRMQVRRSAAPILTQSEQRASHTGDTALEDITGDFEPVGYTEEIRLREERRAREAAYIPPARTGSIRLEAVQEGVARREEAADSADSVDDAGAGGWAYTPARPPKAWTSRSIPGDMSAVQPEPADSPNARAEAAAERKAAAASKTAAPRPRAEAEKPKEGTATRESAAREGAARKPAGTSTGTGTAAAKSVYRKADAAAQPAPEGAEAEKRPRGRPPKPKTEEELNVPKRPRGRPPKPKTEEELNAPKRPRGRPPKPKTEEELNAPKRPRGRPRKNPLPGEEDQAPAAEEE